MVKLIDGEYVVSEGELVAGSVAGVEASLEVKKLKAELASVDREISKALQVNGLPCLFSDRLGAIKELGIITAKAIDAGERLNRKKGTIVTMLHDLINAIEDSGCDTDCTIDDQY